MKKILLPLITLLTLLLVSTVVLADGRPTGIRIGNMRTLGGAGERLEVDITVTGTNELYDSFSTDVWIGNRLDKVNTFYAQPWTSFYSGTYGTFTSFFGGSTYDADADQFVSNAFNVPLPWAIDWGDGAYQAEGRLFGPPGGPWQGTFSHTYEAPGTFNVTVGDAVCCSDSPTVVSGNAISARTRYVWGLTNTTPSFTWNAATYGYTSFGVYITPVVLAITATGSIDATTSIPAMNIYGLLALSFLLVGTGLLLYRKRQPIVA